MANRYPVIVRDGRGRLIIASGHHRSLVALLESRPLLCRTFPSRPDTAIALLPHLLVGLRDRMVAQEQDAADPWSPIGGRPSLIRHGCG